MTDYEDLTKRMRDAAKFLGNTTTWDRTRLLDDGAFAITSLVQANSEVATAVSEPGVTPPSGTELRMAAAHLAAQHGNGPRDATRWLAFLENAEYRGARPAGEWVLPEGEPGEDMRERLERTVGLALGAASVAWTGQPQGLFESSYVSGIVDTLMGAIDAYAAGVVVNRLTEIGGQRKVPDPDPEPTPPAHGFAVGDVVTAERMLDLPHGSVIQDIDGDRFERTDETAYEPTDEHWQRLWDDGDRGAHYSASEIEAYSPVVVVSLPEPTPEPEDTTPRVGDTVRVCEGATHEGCAGLTGTLARRTDGRAGYEITGGTGGTGARQGGMAHYGPLSDFELVERAKVGD